MDDILPKGCKKLKRHRNEGLDQRYSMMEEEEKEVWREDKVSLRQLSFYEFHVVFYCFSHCFIKMTCFKTALSNHVYWFTARQNSIIMLFFNWLAITRDNWFYCQM